MTSKFIGAIFLILGTCIGGSMLALPLTTAREGIVNTLMMVSGAWFMMTIGAFALLWVNLQLPEDSSFISMAKMTLGKTGAILTWMITLFLLYTLLSAYISSGQELLSTIFDQVQWHFPLWFDAIIFTATLGFIVFNGIQAVDYLNRSLMSSKLIICITLIFLLIPVAHSTNLTVHQLGAHHSLMTCITAFGYACVIPSLRSYLNSHKRALHWAIILGGLVPLTLYLAWIFIVQATIPIKTQMNFIQDNNHPLKMMLEALIYQAHRPVITLLTNVFTSICVLTSFLGVALSLSDCLADGMHKRRKGKHHSALILALTLAPPLLIVILFPTIFLNALNYAGILCVLLLFILPLAMTLSLLITSRRKRASALISVR